MSDKQRTYFRSNTPVETSSQYYENFEAYLQSKNIWTTTIERYSAQVEKFENWIEQNTEKSIENVEKKDILDYLHYLNDTLNHAPRTRSFTLAILRHYYTFLCRNQQIATNPTTLIKLRGTKKTTLNKVFSLDEMHDFLDTYFQIKVQPPSEYTHFYQRNYLILSLCVFQGLTRSEWSNIALDHINLQQATIQIQATRKSNPRTLPLHATQIGIFYEYLHHTRKEFPTDNNLLINSKPNTHKLKTTLKKLYPNFIEFKQLRASIITHWIQSQGLRKAQYNAGHRYISSTENYLGGDLEKLKNDINSFHPL